MGLLDGLKGSDSETPMDLVREAKENDHTVGECAELYTEAIELSEERNDDGGSTCTLAHFLFAELLLKNDTADAMEDNPVDVAESHLLHCLDLLEDGHEDEEATRKYMPLAKDLLAFAATRNENWGLAIDRTRQALAHGLPKQFVATALQRLGDAHEHLGNEAVAERYYQDAAARMKQ